MKPPHAAELGHSSIQDLPAHFEEILDEQDLFNALRFLNRTTTYRFTGVYSFEPGLVKCVALADRENPELRVGADVPWFDSYCMMTAGDGTQCEIQNALGDARLSGHPTRAQVQCYCGVLLRTPDGEELGTLCHYDVCARDTAPTVFAGLHGCRASIERHLWERLNLRREALPPVR